jgi:hypothetical protein
MIPKPCTSTGSHNAVANAVSRLAFGLVQAEMANWMTFTKCWCQYTMHAPTERAHTLTNTKTSMVFAYHSEEVVM